MVIVQVIVDIHAPDVQDRHIIVQLTRVNVPAEIAVIQDVDILIGSIVVAIPNAINVEK